MDGWLGRAGHAAIVNAATAYWRNNQLAWCSYFHSRAGVYSSWSAKRRRRMQYIQEVGDAPSQLADTIR